MQTSIFNCEEMNTSASSGRRQRSCKVHPFAFSGRTTTSLSGKLLMLQSTHVTGSRAASSGKQMENVLKWVCFCGHVVHESKIRKQRGNLSVQEEPLALNKAHLTFPLPGGVSGAEPEPPGPPRICRRRQSERRGGSGSSRGECAV